MKCCLMRMCASRQRPLCLFNKGRIQLSVALSFIIFILDVGSVFEKRTSTDFGIKNRADV